MAFKNGVLKMTDQIIQASKDLSKIKGMEKSPWVLMECAGNRVDFLKRSSIITYAIPNKIEIVGSWLRNSSFDGEWSSAAIREGLGLEIWLDCGKWSVESECMGEERLEVAPAADDLAQILGIIEYHKQFPQEVEDYLAKIKT